MALTPPNLSDEASLQMRTAGKEQQFAEKNRGFLQNLHVTGGPRSLLREMNKMDRTLDRPDDKDCVYSESPHTDSLHRVDAKKWDTTGLEAERRWDLQNKQGEQETYLVCEDPRASASVPFSETSIPELSQESTFLKLNYWKAKMGLQAKQLGVDHIDWMEKISNTIQKINATESTMKSLLHEVMSLEGQTENLKDQDLDPAQEANMEKKIMEIRKQLREMSNRLAQVGDCNEAHELKEKLIERIEKFYKDMSLLNTKLGVYHVQERESDSRSSGEMDVEEMEPELPEAAAPPGRRSPLPSPRLAVWKRVLRIFVMFYILTFTGISCYILFIDATFIFERMLPSVLGRSAVWELRQMITPFLNLEVEDLLPS